MKCALHLVTQCIHPVTNVLGRDTCRVAAVRGDWVFHVSGSACLLRKEPIAAALYSPPAPRVFLFAALQALQSCQPFVRVLHCCSHFAAGNDQAVRPVRNGGRMYLAQVDPGDAVPSWFSGLATIFNDDMPVVTAAALVVDQPDFFEILVLEPCQIAR